MKSPQRMKHSFSNHDLLLRKRDSLGEQFSSSLEKIEATVVSPSGGVVVSNRFMPNHQIKTTIQEDRVRHEIRLNSLPKFAGCPDWTKPMMYQEFQVESLITI
jgi:hypothetical protein